MELANVEAFLAVVRHGGFSAAARALHLSQPSISARIRRLEESLGERLFERAGREARLTAAGRHLVRTAEDLARSARDLRRAALDFRGLRKGSLDVGVTDVASIYVLPGAFRRFTSRHPDVDLSVTVEGSLPLVAALRAGRIELAVANLPIDGDDLETSVVDVDRLLPVLPRTHPLAKRKRIRLEEIAEAPMITFKPESVTRREVDRVFTARGLEPRVAMEISSPEAIKKLVEVGLGFAFLPARSVKAEVREGRLASPVLAGVRLERRLGLIRVKGRYLSPAAEAFASLIAP